MLQSRTSERVHFSCRLEVASATGGVPQPARAIDLSLGGVGAVTSAVFSPGQVVTVAFYRRDPTHGEIADRVIGRVAHFAADVDANKLGIQFLEPLKETEHPELVDRLVNL